VDRGRSLLVVAVMLTLAACSGSSSVTDPSAAVTTSARSGTATSSTSPVGESTAESTSSTTMASTTMAPGTSATVDSTSTTIGTTTTVAVTTSTTSTTTTTAPTVTSTPTTSTSTTTSSSTSTTTTTVPTTTSPWATGATWAWFLQGGNIPNVAVDVIDVDLFDTPASEVRRVERSGISTVCYLSAGTYEDWRPDAGDYPPEILGRTWDAWDEQFVDIRRLDLLGPILQARLDLCVAKGFSAVEPDNIDTFWEDTGFPLTADDAVAFARWFASEAHARGLKVAQKNAPDLVGRLVGSFDFAITEDCFDDGWCADMAPYHAAGKAILDAEYTDRMTSLSPALCAQAADLGVSVLLADRNLTENLQRCG